MNDFLSKRLTHGLGRRCAVAMAAALTIFTGGAVFAADVASNPLFAFTSRDAAAMAVVGKYFRSGDYIEVDAARKVPDLDDRIGRDHLFRLSANIPEVKEWATQPCGARRSAGMIIYDPEDWKDTPADEKADVAASVAKAAAIVARSGCRKFAIAPSRSFVTGQTLDGPTLCTSAAGELPRRIDWKQVGVLVIQAQGLQIPACVRTGGLESYARYVADVAGLARAGNPDIIVLAEVSFNRASPELIVRTIERTKGLVHGFYLAYPAGGKCRYCSAEGLESVLARYRSPVAR